MWRPVIAWGLMAARVVVHAAGVTHIRMPRQRVRRSNPCPTVIDDEMANPDEIPRGYLADVALARLLAGNRRFVRGRARFPSVRKEILARFQNASTVCIIGTQPVIPAV
jgi:hypothetical protein